MRERQRLEALGLSLSPHGDPVSAWGYTGRNRDWVGPFSSPEAARQAAFTQAILALPFRSDSTIAEGWTQVEPATPPTDVPPDEACRQYWEAFDRGEVSGDFPEEESEG